MSLYKKLLKNLEKEIETPMEHFLLLANSSEGAEENHPLLKKIYKKNKKALEEMSNVEISDRFTGHTLVIKTNDIDVVLSYYDSYIDIFFEKRKHDYLLTIMENKISFSDDSKEILEMDHDSEEISWSVNTQDTNKRIQLKKENRGFVFDYLKQHSKKDLNELNNELELLYEIKMPEEVLIGIKLSYEIENNLKKRKKNNLENK